MDRIAENSAVLSTSSRAPARPCFSLVGLKLLLRRAVAAEAAGAVVIVAETDAQLKAFAVGGVDLVGGSTKDQAIERRQWWIGRQAAAQVLVDAILADLADLLAGVDVSDPMETRAVFSAWSAIHSADRRFFYSGEGRRLFVEAVQHLTGGQAC